VSATAVQIYIYDNASRLSQEIEVNSTVESVVVYHLAKHARFSVQVAALNTAGEGARSDPVLAGTRNLLTYLFTYSFCGVRSNTYFSGCFRHNPGLANTNCTSVTLLRDPVSGVALSLLCKVQCRLHLHRGPGHSAAERGPSLESIYRVSLTVDLYEG